ncbi:hydrolase, acting on ester bonds, putative [Ricinus communis]|uniref:Hydrolase, acting on ester bonds, putative n=1 Tax=Ricinus communis TaxID=3988 RepID=B9SJ71_RICCO|nr:hydrolase, acting on ester bonds, putative [Ricinus communis]
MSIKENLGSRKGQANPGNRGAHFHSLSVYKEFTGKNCFFHIATVIKTQTPSPSPSSSSSSQMVTRQSIIVLLIILLNIHSQTIHANPIKTVVVLVMENRSFDHMLGWMKKFNPEINGVDGSESNPLNTSDPNSNKVFFQNQAQYVDPDPGHSFQAIREQIFGSNDTSKLPLMNGFAQQALSMDPSAAMSRDVMNGFDPDMVAVYKTLVSEFAVFDRWFASVPSSTQPNRLYVHSGTSAGATSNIPALLIKGYPQRTIFENLDDAKISWGIYFQNIPATLFYRNLRKLKYIGNFHSYDLTFKRHAKEGKLPRYVVVEQRYMDTKLAPANDDHPSHDVHQGQIPDGIVGPEPFLFKFDRLGVRVPTIVVSPWIQKSTVVHGPKGSPFPTSEYEHSSIPATVKKIFNLSSPFLTKRDEWAGTFEGIVQTRKEPRTDCPVQLPTPAKIREGGAKEEAKLSEFQQELLQLAAVLKGDHILTSYPEKIGKEMTVKQGKEYMEDAVKRFFEAGLYAKKMGVDEEQIVQMRPSLTTRSPKPTNSQP